MSLLLLLRLALFIFGRVLLALSWNIRAFSKLSLVFVTELIVFIVPVQFANVLLGLLYTFGIRPNLKLTYGF